MKKSLEVKLIPVILLALFVVSVFACINYYHNKQTENSNYWLNHTHQVLITSEKLLSSLETAAFYNTGFLVTGDSAFVPQDDSSKYNIEKKLAALKYLTSDNPSQQARIDSLKTIIGAKNDLFTKVQGTVHNSNYTNAGILPFLQGNRKSLTHSIQIITAIQKEENRLLLQRSRVNEANIKTAKRISIIFLVTMLLLLAVAVFASWLLTRTAEKQDNSQTQLTRRISLFSRRIDDVIKGISDSFFSLDKNFAFIYYNDIMQRTMAVGKGLLMGKKYFEVFPQQKNSVMHQKMNEVLQFQRPASFEMYCDFLDQWQDVSIYPTSEGIATYIRDATKRKRYEKELNDMQQLLDETSAMVAVGGWKVDVASGVVAWTSATHLIFETATDYKPDLKKVIKFYKEGTDRETIVHLINDAIEQGKGWDGELRIITAKGNEKWIRTKGNAELKNGACTRLFGTIQDIDIQKKMQVQLQEKEKQFRNAFENRFAGMAFISIDGCKWLDVNETLCKITGYSKSEFLLKPVDAITHPEDLPNDHESMDAICKNPAQSFQYEKRYIHKNSHEIWVLYSLSAVTASDGSIRYFLSQMQDITQRKFHEQRLKYKRDLLRDIIDNLPLNLYMKDIYSRKTLVNKNELLYSGYKKYDDILGKTDFDLYPYDTAKISVEEDKKIIATKQAILNKETKSVKNDGTVTIFLTSKIPFFNEAGEVTSILGISYKKDAST